jgi:hypothetical protein
MSTDLLEMPKAHVHDFKFAGVNPKMKMLGGQRMTGKLYRCRCGAVQIKGAPAQKEPVGGD